MFDDLGLLAGVIHMGMWKLKGCPRCRGDIYIGIDLPGLYQQCLQCGYESDSPITVKIHQPTDNRERNQLSGLLTDSSDISGTEYETHDLFDYEADRTPYGRQ